MKTFAWFDENDAELVVFKKLWVKHKKYREPLPANITCEKLRHGYVGSGEWIYKMGDSTFKIDGQANGRGFWGTDYYIYRVDNQ